MTLFAHQQKGVAWLTQRNGAGLFWEMGVGKSRTALEAAKHLYNEKKIDRVLILAPAAVVFAWRQELEKLSDFTFTQLLYNASKQAFFRPGIAGEPTILPVGIVSYSMLSQGERKTKTDKHGRYLEAWCQAGDTVLICDESSFLKSRTAKQTKATMHIAEQCRYRWLLSGTPICNSILDLYAQGKVMSPSGGPLGRYENFYHFQASVGNLVPVINKNGDAHRVYGRGPRGRMQWQTLKEFHQTDEGVSGVQKLFAPYVSRVEKADCLDLPPKSYTVREVALSEETWRIYQELKREAMLALPDNEAKPEPNAAVRILRLCQLTSGHVGGHGLVAVHPEQVERAVDELEYKDVSREKIDYLADAIIDGELANERALICWCRWRRERERLYELLDAPKHPEIGIAQIFGGQSERERNFALETFMHETRQRIVMLAQPHAGGFGLNLTAAHTAVYLSNDWSYSTRVQSEDRTHRIGQANPCLYIDVVAVGPRGQQTVDHKILEALRAKKSVAEWTTSAWRRALEDE